MICSIARRAQTIFKYQIQSQQSHSTIAKDFEEDVIYKELLLRGFVDLYEIRTGSIVGRVTGCSGSIVIPVQICPNNYPYSQDDFEIDLKKLLQEIEKLSKIVYPN